MPDEFASLAKLIQLYKRGLIGPSEMWLPLFERLRPATASDFLKSLPPELTNVLLDEYQGEARYRFEPPHDVEFAEVKQIIRDHLESASS